MSDYYILDGNVPVPASKEQWEAGLESHKVATDQGGISPWLVSETQVGSFRIKTIFTGHRFSSEPDNPLFFVTEVFRGLEMVDADELYRASTWSDALESHIAVVREVGRRPDSYA